MVLANSAVVSVVRPIQDAPSGAAADVLIPGPTGARRRVSDRRYMLITRPVEPTDPLHGKLIHGVLSCGVECRTKTRAAKVAEQERNPGIKRSAFKLGHL